MNVDFRRALGWALTVLFVSVGLATLLAQATAFERPETIVVLGRLVGHGGLGVVMLLALQTPVLIGLRAHRDLMALTIGRCGSPNQRAIDH